MIKPAKTAPKNGDAIIKIANITAITPTPMEKPRTHPFCVLSPNPCIILAMPSNNNASPRKKNSTDCRTNRVGKSDAGQNNY